MDLRSARLLRTPYSERHAILLKEVEIAAVDIHYLLDGRVAGTLTIFQESGVSENDISKILIFIDNDLLPEVDINEKNLIFTVVVGRVLGSFTPNENSNTV